VCPRRPIHLPVSPRRPIQLPVNITVNSRREKKAQNAAVLYLRWSAVLHECRADEWGTQNYQAHSCRARHSLCFVFTSKSPCSTLLGLAVDLGFGLYTSCLDPTQQTRSQRGCNSVCPRRPIHLPINPRRPIHLPVNTAVNSRREQEAQNAAVLYLTWSAVLHECRTDKWGTQNYQQHSWSARHSLCLLPKHPVALTPLGLAVTLNKHAVKYTDIKYAKSWTMGQTILNINRKFNNWHEMCH